MKNKITERKEGERKWYCVEFGNKIFYKFLNQIGIENAKSKTIKSVQVPDKFFADFLLGEFGGDGSFWTFKDKRWPNSFGYRMSFPSASKKFINWLNRVG